MLTVKQCPYTGPYGLPSSGLRSKGPTAKALKRAMSRLGHLPWGVFDEHFNDPLSDALNQWDPGHSGYGKGRWEKIRAARVPAGMAQAGEYALDAVGLQLIRDDYVEQHPPPPPMPSLVYPHDKNWRSYCGGYLHTTGGISGNRAYDFLAEPGTPVLAVEDGTVSRTAGHDPALGLFPKNVPEYRRDVFGWSLYVRCRWGFYYSTHYGQLVVGAGSVVKAGDIIGFVGHWPGDIGRSHTHYGYTAWSHINAVSDSKMRKVAAAPHVSGNPRV